MSPQPPISPAWSRRRFLLVSALLFVGQVACVFLLEHRPTPLAIPLPPRMVLRLLDTTLDDEKWSRQMFAGDPTAFPTSSPRGFAAQSWERLRARDEAPPLLEPPPAFLAFATTRLSLPRPYALPSSWIPYPLAGPLEPPLPNSSDFPAVPANRPDSALRLEGPLAGRLLNPPRALPSWASNSLVANSVVQIAVNPSGQVISSALLACSGVKEADDLALTAVNKLRFRPIGPTAPAFVWDTVTFYWKTIEPPPKPGP